MKFKYGSRRKAIEYEKDWVEKWKQDKTFEKSVAKNPESEAYVFYDGPPFITGNPHHGTLLSSIVKDCVPRYQTMKGKRVERVWGWDCHGLPAENFTEKHLGGTISRAANVDSAEKEFGAKKPDETEKNAIIAIVKNPKNNKVLVLDWGERKENWGGKMFIGGGIEKDENPIDTAKREIAEETGYKNVRLIKQASQQVHNHFYSNVKNKNMFVHFLPLLFELDNEEQIERNLDENEGQFTIQWVDEDKLKDVIDEPAHYYGYELVAGVAPKGEMLQLKAGDKTSTISLEEYITTARDLMVANSETWEQVVDRIGRWVDFKGAYKTMDKDFMESVWWAFKTLYDKGLIYEGKKVLMYDTKFATPVSKNEVTMDNDAYRTVTDPSVFVKFKIEPREEGFSDKLVDDVLSGAKTKSIRLADSERPDPKRSYVGEIVKVVNSKTGKKIGFAKISGMKSMPLKELSLDIPGHTPAYKTHKDMLAGLQEYYEKKLTLDTEFTLYEFELLKENPANTFLLAWTTTPWTLPANMALAVNPKMKYVEVAVNSAAEKPNFVILHGFTGFEDGKSRAFSPWLANELEQKGYDVQSPILPNSDNPDVQEQVKFVLDSIKFDKNTVLIGHSLGGIVAMETLEKLPVKIRELILVAPAIPKSMRAENEMTTIDGRPAKYLDTFSGEYDWAKIQDNVGRVKLLSDSQERSRRGKFIEYLAQKLDVRVDETKSEKVHFLGTQEPFVLESIKNVFDNKTENLILAKDLAPKVLTDEKHQPLDYKIVREMSGKDLVGLEYESILNGSTKNKIFLISGKHADASREYFPLLKKQFEKDGFDVTIIDHIDPDNPNRDENIKNLDNYDFENAHIITHSLGSSTFLSWLERNDVKITSLDMIAPTYPGKSLSSTNENWLKTSGYVGFELDYENIKKKIAERPTIIYSDDGVLKKDLFIKLGERLNAKMVYEEGKGHFFNTYEPENDKMPDYKFQYVPILTDEKSSVVSENAHKVYVADFVEDEGGTGIVHIAPAYGEDDYVLAEKHKIPVKDVLDDEGFYLPETAKQLAKIGVKPTHENGGIEVWEANKHIAKCLQEKGIVWKIEYIRHEYPFNPRSNQRIMYRAFPSWFFDVQGQKPLMLTQNENIEWFPPHIKHGRFQKNIEAAPDWNISRDRFWATAMPVWKGDKGTIKVVGSYAELKELSGVELPDYHRPWVDEIEFDLPTKPTEVYFVRHGQTDANLAEVAGMETSETDSPLNATGVKQSQKTRDELNDVKIDLIISSPYQRAKQTAEIINEYHNAPIVFEKDLREIDVPRNLGEEKFHTLFDIEKNISIDGSETISELLDRVYKVLDGVKEKHQGKNILVVAHGGTHHGLYSYFNKLERKGNLRIDRLHNADYRKYTFENDETEHFKRVDKVLDCWFESGSMPFAQMHYPFENKTKFEANYPADFIVEYVAQVRAWFYYIHVINTALFGENAFKNCIVTGTIAGNDGRKMSKSLGNYTDPNELMDEYSADSLRFLLLSSPLLSGEDFALKDKDVSDVARKLSMVWNVYDFFTMYAEVDGFEIKDAEYFLDDSPMRFAPNYNEKPWLTEPDYTKELSHWLKNPLDIWIVSRVHQLHNSITENMDKYNIPEAMSAILPFIDDLSNWFVRRSRRRFWKSEDDADKNEAYRTLHYVLCNLSLLLAPFTPFMAEELWHLLVDPSSSVHLAGWADISREIDEKVLSDMARAREIIEKGLALRMEREDGFGQIKIRQPLSTVAYPGEKLDEFYERIIQDELNVKEVINAPVATGYDGKGDKNLVRIPFDGSSLALDKKITPELKREGLSREVVRAVQKARKDAGLNVDDRIVVNLTTQDAELQQAIDEHRGTIATEVLAVEFAKNDGFSTAVKIDGAELKIELKKKPQT